MDSRRVFVFLLAVLAGSGVILIGWPIVRARLLDDNKDEDSAVLAEEEEVFPHFDDARANLRSGLPREGSNGETKGILKPGHTTLLFLTDPHGFYARNRHEDESMDANYADFAAFAEHMKNNAASLPGCHVHLFENGDMVDGGGLTDEPGGRAKTFKVLSRIGFDARTIGNHELYEGDTLDDLKEVLPGSFVSTNVRFAKREGREETKVGEFYRLIRSHHGLDPLLTFGFLYNMKNNDHSQSVVHEVQDIVESQEFIEVLMENQYRAIVVLAHMDFRDPLVTVILKAIRQVKPRIPVVFATGHSHIRRSRRLDDYAFTLEAGKFGDTIGIVTFRNPGATDTPIEFDSRYVSASTEVLKRLAGVPELETDTSLQVRNELNALREELGLNRIVGYVPRTLSTHVPFDAENSLIRFWVYKVIPKEVFSRSYNSCPAFFIGGSGSIRFDLYKGPVTLDDLWALAPFRDGFRVVRCVSGSVLLNLLEKLKHASQALLNNEEFVGVPRLYDSAFLPAYVWSDPKSVSETKLYDIMIGAYDAPTVVHLLNKLRGNADEFQDEPFRADEINQHTIWESYFNAHPPPLVNDNESISVVKQ